VRDGVRDGRREGRDRDAYLLRPGRASREEEEQDRRAAGDAAASLVGVPIMQPGSSGKRADDAATGSSGARPGRGGQLLNGF